MPTIKQAQQLTKNDLNAYFYVAGSLSDPYTVTVTLFDSTTGTDQIIGLPERIPVKFEVGSYYVQWTVPSDEPTGLHRIRWRYRESATSAEIIKTEDFTVLPYSDAVEKQYPEYILYLIKNLRAKLRDIDPSRDYHLAPPSSETDIHGFTQVRGFRWPDEQLYLHIVMAANYINLIPPDTDFDIENYPAPWQPLMLQIAMSYALWDLAILWINEEFSYSLNGISLDLARSDKYQGAAQSLLDQANTQLEVAKRRIHIVKGLRQSRYIFGFGSGYLGPWTSGITVKKWAFGSQYGRSVRGFF
jgi:hypothetical protein